MEEGVNLKTYFYYTLSEKEKANYDNIVQALGDSSKNVKIKPSANNMNIMNDILNNYPQYFYIANQFYIKSMFGNAVLELQYTLTQTERNRLRNRLDEKVNTILLDCTNKYKQDFDKVVAFHDYLIQNAEYDERELNSSDLQRDFDIYTVVGAFLKGNCVCSGFARAMKLLCDRAGIDCMVITGTANANGRKKEHAWNLVKVGGRYHHVDVTWDKQQLSGREITNYAYMNLDDNEIEVDHEWNRRHYPACPEAPCNYYVYTGTLMETEQQLERFLKEKFNRQEDRIMFKVKRGSALSGVIQKRLQTICMNAANQCSHVAPMSFEWEWLMEVQVYLMKVQY